MQEPVLLQAEVDERRLEPGQDVVDLALVDVADDGSPTATLNVELRDVGLGDLRPCFEYCYARLAAIGGHEDCLFHLNSVLGSARKNVRRPVSGTQAWCLTSETYQANLLFWERRACM